MPGFGAPLSHFRSIFRIALIAVIFLSIAWLAPRLQSLEPDRIAAWFADFGPLAPSAFILVRMIGAVVFVPGSLMGIGAGILFGPVWGAIYNLVGSTFGAILAFSVARFLAPDWVTRRVVRKPHLSRLLEGIEAEGWRFVAFVRLVPLFPYNLLNYALGLTRIKFSHYALATLICMIPADIAYVYLGYAAREAVAGNEAAVRTGLLSLGLLAGLAFIPRWVRRYRARRDKPDGDVPRHP